MTPREVLLAANAAFSRRDADAMVVYYAPDATVLDHRPGGWGEWQGRGVLHAYYAGICESTASLDENLRVVEERGASVLADCHLTARIAGEAGGELALDYALVAVVRDDLIQRLDIHPDLEAAQAATPATS